MASTKAGKGKIASRSSSGGSGEAGGSDFQACVASWFAVGVLADSGASPRWNLGEATRYTFVRCQSGQDVDDLLVGTSEGGYLFIQAKRTVQLLTEPTSELGKTCAQFVHQYLRFQHQYGANPWERPLNAARDRLLLVVGRECKDPVRRHLAKALVRLHGLQSDQPLAALDLSQDQRHALQVVQKHITAAWVAAGQGNPNEADLKLLLSLIYVTTLDVEEDGSDEELAKDRLRLMVLRDSNQAGLAWDTLFRHYSKAAKNRTGDERSQLEALLEQKTLVLRAPHRYWPTISKFLELSRSGLQLQALHTGILLPTMTLLFRRSCLDEALLAAQDDGFVLVGEPGAGKTGLLVQLCRMLRFRGRDVLFLSAEQMSQLTGSGIPTLEHDLIDTLKNWPGSEPGYVVIDALDAAREESKAESLRNAILAIRATSTRWQVIAAIRIYDLRYSPLLQQAFAGTPVSDNATYQLAEFRSLRHLWLPPLNEEELRQAIAPAPGLVRLIEGASSQLRTLLCNPFNLQLAAELLAAGLSTEAFDRITTQIDLLERYWSHRIIRNGRRHEIRQHLLRTICLSLMEQRTLDVARQDVATSGDYADAIDDLLEQHLLVETTLPDSWVIDRETLAFSHLILRDYAIARLLLRDTPAKVEAMLTYERDRIILLAPSLTMHFSYLWVRTAKKREPFWDLVTSLMRSEKLPEIGKVQGPAVAVEAAQAIEDLDWLYQGLQSADEPQRTLTQRIFLHLTGAILSTRRPLVGTEAGPWCALLEQMTRSLRQEIAPAVRAILTELLQEPDALADAQRSDAGLAARRLLEFGWGRTPPDMALAVPALTCVCRTFSSDPAASAILLRQSMVPAHVTTYGYVELPRIARELRHVIRHDADLVAALYGAAFAYAEPSEDKTPLGMRSSTIFSLVSSRRQEYQDTWYRLATEFAHFCQQVPQQSVKVLALTLYATQVRASFMTDRVVQSFDFNGQPAQLRADGSNRWDRAVLLDDIGTMLNTFQQCLAQLCATPEQMGIIEEVVDTVRLYNESAAFWRLLLSTGAQYPTTLGLHLRSLLWAPPILSCSDTTAPAGDLLRAIFPLLAPAERERIERAVLNLPDTVEAEHRISAEYARNRLIGCLPDVTMLEETRVLRDRLQETGSIYPNTELPRQAATYVEERTRDVQDPDRIADANMPSGHVVHNPVEAVRRFARTFMSEVPETEAITAIFPEIQAVRVAVDSGKLSGPEQTVAWAALAWACSRITLNPICGEDERLRQFARQVLLDASRHRSPAEGEESHVSYNFELDVRRWAAEGLLPLAHHHQGASPDILEAVLRLSADPVPMVRCEIARRLHALEPTAPDLMWQLLAEMAGRESHPEVQEALTKEPLRRLLGVEHDRVAAITTCLLAQVGQGEPFRTVRANILTLFALSFLWRGHAPSHDQLWLVMSSPVQHALDLRHLIFTVRDQLAYYPDDTNVRAGEAVRANAREIYRFLLGKAQADASEIRAAHTGSPYESWPEASKAAIQALLGIAQAAASAISYLSGALARAGQTPPVALNSLQRQRLYEELQPIIDHLIAQAHPAVAYDLVGALIMFIVCDPPGVFLRIADAVRESTRDGYLEEWLGADQLVAVVERYLADYRHVFRQNTPCREALVDLLDSFVRAGWPAAFWLIYRLDAIYR